jgi:predicted MPP superfamily phosphohydrolase
MRHARASARPSAHSDSRVAFEPPRRLERGPRVQALELLVHGLDPVHDGLRVAHLTDVHVGLITPAWRIRAAIERANEAAADLVVLTGDYVCYSPRYVPVLESLMAGLRGPVVAVLGNHDYWTDGAGVARALARNGYQVLRNQHTTLTVRGRPLTVVGIDDAITRHDDVDASFRGLPSHPRAGSRVVLTHAPGLVKHAAARGGGLVLAGHTHGAQIHIPRLSQKLWNAVGKPFVKGVYRVGDATLYVNSGVGTSSIPLRAGAPSEVAVLTLRSPALARAAGDDVA